MGAKWSAAVTGRGRLLSAPGVPEGTYSLSPIFVGGIRGPSQSVGVQQERSTLVSVGAARVGALSISAAPDICQQIAHVRIVRVISRGSHDSRGAGWLDTRIEPAVTLALDNACTSRVAGLPPGLYGVTFDDGTSVITERQVAVTAQATTSVMVDGGTVVGGIAYLNGEPLAGINVQFRNESQKRWYSAKAPTDESGLYEAVMPSAGVYRVRFLQGYTELMGQEQQAVITPGVNRLDWYLQGGVIRITLTGWDRHPDGVELTVARTPLELGTTAVSMKAKAGDTSAVLRGLTFGAYTVICGTEVLGPGQLVHLSNQHPEVDVALDLAKSSCK
jgi:hypothetical protein